VLSKQIGVNRAANVELPGTFTRVIPLDELVESQPQTIQLNDTPVVVVRKGDDVFALVGRCSHAGGPLGEGKVEADTIKCPWHGSTFKLATGEVVTGPTSHPQPCLQARVVEGWVEVRFDETQQS
jgi:nitrite reductase/ring-hydroxylating ferredoxin subunit